jgi:hypothetical protein
MAQPQLSNLQPLLEEGQEQVTLSNLQPLPVAPGSQSQQPEPGLLETANQYYNKVAPGEGILSRIGKGLGRAAMVIPNAASAMVSPATEEEKKEGYNDPLAYAGPLQVHRLLEKPSTDAYKHVDEMARAQEAREQAGTAKFPRVVRQAAEVAGKGLAMVPIVGPYALGTGERVEKTGDVAGTVAEIGAMSAAPEIAKEAMPGGAIPGSALEPGETSAFPTLQAAVRGAGKTVNAAKNVLPIVAPVTGAIEGAVKGGPLGSAVGSATGGTLGRLSRAIPDVPESVTEFGNPTEVRNINHLQKAFDTADKAFNKAAAERAKYSASEAEGVNPPVDVVKKYETAARARDEAQYHLDTAKEAAARAKSGMPKARPSSTVQPAVEQAAKQTTGVPKASRSINVKGPGEVAPEIVNPDRVQRFENLEQPKVPGFSEDITLANEEGVRTGRNPGLKGAGIGQRLLPPADTGTIEPPAPKTPEGEILPPDDTSPEQIRHALVPRKEMAGLYTQPVVEEAAPEAASQASVEKPKAAQQVTKAGDLIQQSLGGKKLEPNVPLREQLTNAPKRVEEPAQVPEQANKELSKSATEQEAEGHDKQLVHANGEALANAIPKTPEGRALLQKFHDLSNVELRQLAINAGEDMGQLKIGRKKLMGKGQITRPEVFERMLKNHSAEDLGRMMDEGKHLPPVSGGSQGARAAEKPQQVVTNASGESSASQEAINRQASEKRQGIKRYRVDSRSNRAVPLIGPDAVDAKAGKFEHIVQVNADGSETVLDSGDRAAPRLKSARIIR